MAEAKKVETFIEEENQVSNTAQENQNAWSVLTGVAYTNNSTAKKTGSRLQALGHSTPSYPITNPGKHESGYVSTTNIRISYAGDFSYLKQSEFQRKTGYSGTCGASALTNLAAFWRMKEPKLFKNAGSGTVTQDNYLSVYKKIYNIVGSGSSYWDITSGNRVYFKDNSGVDGYTSIGQIGETFSSYKGEIDANKPVILLTQGHQSYGEHWLIGIGYYTFQYAMGTQYKYARVIDNYETTARYMYVGTSNSSKVSAYAVHSAINSRWLRDGSNWKYAKNRSTFSTGWQLDGSRWYYFNSGGVMQIGWIQVSGKWYYLRTAKNVPVAGPQGAMITGWAKDPTNGNWYYMNSSGAMQTGWLNDGGYKYFLHSNGTMGTGWIYTGGYWYYARKTKNNITSGPAGALLISGTWPVDGKSYKFDANGRCLNP